MSKLSTAPLGPSVMADIIKVFVETTEHVLGNYLSDSHEPVNVFMHQLVLQEKPYMLVTEEGLERIKLLVFGREVIRDFILTLSFHFFSRLAQDTDTINSIASALAMGAAIDSDRYLTQMPDAIRDRLETFDRIQALISANRWLMVILLIQLSCKSESVAPDARKNPPRKP